MANFSISAKFISVLGKPGEYANDESPVIRKWRAIAAPADGDLPKDDAPWMAAYSKVDGELPGSELAIGERVLVRGYVNVQIAGAVKLDINSLDGLQLWIDGHEVADLLDPIDLSEGRRILTFAIDRTRRGEAGLRVELAPVPGSPIKFQPEGGL